MSKLAIVFVFCFSIFRSEAQFEIPPVTIQVTEERQLVVSIPDVQGIKMFGFHGRINEVIHDDGDKAISGDVMQQIDGKWTLYKENTILHENDEIYYWLFVVHDNFGYRLDGQSYLVKNLYPKINFVIPQNRSDVKEKQLKFSDNFENGINESNWIIEHILPSDQQESPFVSYQKSNVKVVNGKLEITPTFLSEADGWDEDQVEGSDEMTMGPDCTGVGNECEQKGTQVPPIVSGRISTRTKFSFKYGKIEIRAKLPVGSWLYPEIYLEPEKMEYGSKNYESGVMRVAFVRGNNEFSVNNVAMDNKVLFGGLVLTNEETCRSLTTKNNKNSVPWGDGFHTYGMIWEADKITLQVDGKTYGVIVYPRGLKSMGENCPKIKEASRVWGIEPTLIPFDQEFHITLGVGVGGIADFPDTPTKPWKNTGRKARFNFWSERNEWYDSWLPERKKLIVESVNVWDN